MGTDAVIMLVIGALGLWGTLALAIVNYLRRSARDTAGRSEN